MGNGNNRNKRGGARTRHGPHRGGGNGANRNAMHLMPQPSAAQEAPVAALMSATQGADDDDATLEQAEEAEVAEEIFEGRAGELHGGSQPAPTPAPGIEVATAPATPDPEPEPTPEPLANRASLVAPESSATPELDEPAPEPERPAPRGRFERFYAPGQGPRTERNSASRSVGTNGTSSQRPVSPTVSPNETPAAHAAAPATPPAPAAPPAQPAGAPPASSAPLHAAPAYTGEVDEDEADAAPSVPREDVRGPVGGLIDSLHELFAADRAVASQGGASRCGICYFHFPVSALVYREAEGFYVCENCARSLGMARVDMVRRQQRL